MHLTADHRTPFGNFRSAELMDPTRLTVTEEAEPDPAKRQTLLQQISRMNVSQRVQFAMKGSGEARRALIRDSNKVVQGPCCSRLVDRSGSGSLRQHVEPDRRNSAADRDQPATFERITQWFAIMNNPKTPLDVTLHMFPC